MEITTCYTAALKSQAAYDKKTDALTFAGVDERVMAACSALCLDALKFCTEMFLTEWSYISAFPETPKRDLPGRRRICDTLIHATRDNAAKYAEFDRSFPNMPAGIRRMIISDALGIVSSYVSNHQNWENTDPKTRGTEPSIGYPKHYELTFYSTERSTGELQKGTVMLKLWNGKEWAWYVFRLRLSDAKYIARMAKERRMLSPIVCKMRDGYRIRFCFAETKTLPRETNPLDSLVMGVDLGINAAASWCVMDSAGTVFAKGVTHLANEEGRLRHAINRKKKYQQAGKKSHSVYRLLNNANRMLSIETTRAILRIAETHGVDRVVFEYLDTAGKKKGALKERLHMWKARDIEARVELQAHRRGIRVSRVCAWGTSKYAYDGSGITNRKSVYVWKRGKKRCSYSLCTFQNGKVYNCDLSAAQNIAARFFLREYAKRKDCPELPKTSMRTLRTLWDIQKPLTCRKDAA